MTDKNGNEIRVGDIVRADYYDKMFDPLIAKVQCIFSEERIQIQYLNVITTRFSYQIERLPDGEAMLWMLENS